MHYINDHKVIPLVDDYDETDTDEEIIVDCDPKQTSVYFTSELPNPSHSVLPVNKRLEKGGIDHSMKLAFHLLQMKKII